MSRQTSFVVDRDSVTVTNKIIGKGTSSQVYEATIHCENGDKDRVAAKRVHRSAGEKEIKILARLSHKNIIKFKGAVPALEGLDTYILMEIATKGDLFNHMRSIRGPVPITLRWRWIIQAAWAIQYLHKEGLAHKDIKSPNFLITGSNTLKLGDFGHTAVMHGSQASCGSSGTERWMAPEVLIRSKRSKKSDVYSYGVVVWEMQTGEVPFRDMNAKEVTICIYEGGKLDIPEENCQPLIERILKRCLESDEKRPSMDEVLNIIPIDIINTFESPSWCSCKACQFMPKKIERKCCGNSEEHCLSQQTRLKEILDKAYPGCTTYKSEEEKNKDSSDRRRKTYRKFIDWQYGKRGRGKRMPIPSCCVWKIREYYPDSKSKYIGFVEG